MTLKLSSHVARWLHENLFTLLIACACGLLLGIFTPRAMQAELRNWFTSHSGHPMTREEQFIQLVTQMRAAQKAYFAAEHGTPEKHKQLSLSKELERRVDAWLKDVTKDQLRLF